MAVSNLLDVELNRVAGVRQALGIAAVANIQRPLSAREERHVRAVGAEAVALLEPALRGLRPLHPDHVAALVHSVREWGLQDYPWFAVLRDQHGCILSGWHRLAAAMELGLRWPTRTVAVPNEAAALKLALVANIRQGWSPRQWRALECAGIANVGRTWLRQVIHDALDVDDRQKTHRSNRDIAREVLRMEVTKQDLALIREVRAVMEHNAEFRPAAWRRRWRASVLIGAGAGRDNAENAEHGRWAQTRARIRAALREDPRRSDRAIGRLVGCDGKTVGVVRAQMEQNAETSAYRGRPGRGHTEAVPRL